MRAIALVGILVALCVGSAPRARSQTTPPDLPITDSAVVPLPEPVVSTGVLPDLVAVFTVARVRLTPAAAPRPDLVAIYAGDLLVYTGPVLLPARILRLDTTEIEIEETAFAQDDPACCPSGYREQRLLWLRHAFGTVPPCGTPGTGFPPCAGRDGPRPPISARVAGNAGDDCLNVRDQPSRAGAVLACLPAGQLLTIDDTVGPIGRDDFIWRLLSGGGWVADEFLTFP